MLDVLKNSNYQTFDILGDSNRDSNSAEKFKLSKLETFDFNSCLDIGCNAGYFLFRLLSKPTVSKLVGIDNSKKYIDIALELNNQHFKSNVDFVLGDIFEHNFNTTFDLIICFSTFHHLKRQDLFFELCYNLLEDGGTLLVEVEEYPINTEPDFSTRTLSDGRVITYPNELKLKEYIKGKFDIVEKYDSVRQNGASHPRYFYKLKKHQRVIIVVGGESKLGKTAVTKLLLNDKFLHVSTDLACMELDHNISVIHDFHVKNGMNAKWRLNTLYSTLALAGYEEFIDYIFNKYIYTTNLNIIIEGYIFKFQNIYEYFAHKSKTNNFRIWNLTREI